MLFGRYYVLLEHQLFEERPENWHPNAWMGRHDTHESALHQGRHLAGFFQKVRVWDSKEQEWAAIYLQYRPLGRDLLDPGHMEFYKTELERPEGKVQTIKRRGIHAFNRHDRTADYEAKQEAKRHANRGGHEGEQSDSEDLHDA